MGPLYDRPQSPEPSAPEQRLRVLVADDEPLILRAVTRLLEKRGHEIQAVPDAYRALELLRAGTFDAVLVDANMPGGGASVLAYLHETKFGGIKVLMTGELAADAQGVPEDVRRLQKPFRYGAVAPLIEVSPQG
ncbi:MAG: response regulator [Gemmatimonadetes bacterium]|nr:response regulator [Gemmatimonadota bacterium]